MLAVKDIPDLQFHAAEPEEKGESAMRTDVMEIMDVDTKESVTTLQNSIPENIKKIHWKVQQVEHQIK